MFLTIDEIRLILNLIREKYGTGYITDPLAVGQLQAKLAITGEAISRVASAKARRPPR